MHTEPLLTPEQCSHLIAEFHRYSDLAYTHRPPNRAINVDQLIQHTDDDVFKILRYMLDSHIRSVADRTFINYFELVEWPEGSSQSTHLDYEYHSWTTIVYLNDDFSGGQTLVGNNMIQPQQGMAVSFQGRTTQHSVLPVAQGTRYTLAAWYKTFD